MGLGFCIVLLDLLICCFVRWIVLYWLDHIVWIVSLDCIDWIGFAGLDRLDWIGSYRLDEDT